MNINQLYESIVWTKPLIKPDVIKLLVKHFPDIDGVGHRWTYDCVQYVFSSVMFTVYGVDPFYVTSLKQQQAYCQFKGDVNQLNDVDKLYLKVSADVASPYLIGLYVECSVMS